MNTVLLYLYVQGNPEFHQCALRFIATYKQYDPGEPHKLHVVTSEGPVTDTVRALFSGICDNFSESPSAGWDIGAEQYMARQIDCDFLVCMTSRSYFWRAGWLKRLADERRKHGEGLYGTTGSYESCPLTPHTGKNPHIRTAMYAMNPHIYRRYPYTIDSRDKGFMFESGPWNFATWFREIGYPTLMVAWDGCYDVADWRKPPNIFRRGNQSNVLAFDRHTLMYEQADPARKAALARSADAT